MSFRVQAIQEALWPEALGVGTYGVGMLVAASIDTAMREQGNYQAPVAQNIVTYGSLVGGVLGVGYNKAKGFSKGLMYASAVGIVLRSLATLWEAARREPARARLADVGALIPRRVGSASRPAAGGRGLSLGGRVALQPAGQSPRLGHQSPRMALSGSGISTKLPASTGARLSLQPSGTPKAYTNDLPRSVLPEVTQTRGM